MSTSEIRLTHNGDHVSVSRSNDLRSFTVPAPVFNDGQRFEKTMERFRNGDLSFLKEPEWAEANPQMAGFPPSL